MKEPLTLYLWSSGHLLCLLLADSSPGMSYHFPWSWNVRWPLMSRTAHVWKLLGHRVGQDMVGGRDDLRISYMNIYMVSLLDQEKKTLQWVGCELLSWLEKNRFSSFLMKARKDTLINRDEWGKEVSLAQAWGSGEAWSIGQSSSPAWLRVQEQGWATEMEAESARLRLHVMVSWLWPWIRNRDLWSDERLYPKMKIGSVGRAYNFSNGAQEIPREGLY